MILAREWEKIIAEHAKPMRPRLGVDGPLQLAYEPAKISLYALGYFSAFGKPKSPTLL